MTPPAAPDYTTEAQGIARPKLPVVALVAPARRGRQIANESVALAAGRVRLLLAWKHRAALADALHSTPPFHEHLWSAERVLSGAPADEEPETDEAILANSPVATLAGLLRDARTIVRVQTQPNDEARRALGFGKRVDVSRSLPASAKPWVAAARKLAPQFTAFTEPFLAELETALVQAARYAEHVTARDERERAASADASDKKQLATDVFLDGIDRLRAAAISTFRTTRPELAAFLSAPLPGVEGASSSADEDPEEDPAPAPAPAPTK